MSISPAVILSFTAFIAVISWISWNLTLDAWWQPTDRQTAFRMLELLDLQPGEVVYDLGCGDGRLVIQAVRDFDLEAVGIEIDPVRVIIARLRILAGGVSPDAKVIAGDMYKEDLSGANGILLFLSGEANEKLGPKFDRELDAGTRIVSYYHELPNWSPIHEEENSKGYPIYLYEVKGREERASRAAGSN